MDNKNIQSYLLASTSSAIMTKTCTAPITRIKVLQQIQSYHNYNNYTGISNSIKYIYKNEGLLGYFKGNLTNISKSIPNYCIKFPLNDIYLKYMLKNKNFSSIKQLPYNNLLQAGVFAGLFQTIFTYPIDLLRTRITQDSQMINTNNKINSCLKNIIKQDGIAGLYRGFTPALLSTPLYIGIQLSSYQYLKNTNTIISNSLISGACAGLISQTIMYPGDTIKRNLQIDGLKQTKYNNLIDCIKHIYSKNGFKGFYRGIFLNSFKSIPEVAIKFTTYDLIKEYFL